MAEKDLNKGAMSTRAYEGLLGDVRRQNNFVLHINDVFEGNSLELIVDQAFLPSVSLNVLNLRHGNDSKKLAGVATWSGGTVVFKDVLSRKELDKVLAWFNQTYGTYDTEDITKGAIGIADEYKKSGYVTEFAGDRRYQRRWDLNGLWISDINLGELNSGSDDLKEITITIEIDPSPLKPVYTDSINTSWSDQ